MRPKIIEFLNGALGMHGAAWLIPTPEVLYGVAMLAVLLLYVIRCRSGGLSRYHALGSAIWATVGGLVGARAIYLALRIDQVVRDPSMLWDLGGTTMSWGAYLGGGVGFTLYMIVNRQSLWHYADVVGSTFGLGPFFGRMACFLNGDDYGRISDVPWAVTYPEGSIAYGDHLRQGLLPPGAEESLAVHPVQLYLAANALALFLIFSWLWRRAKLPPGTVFLLYWAAYGATRFGWEFFRGDIERVFVGPFPDAQVIALVICLSSIAALVSCGGFRGTARHPEHAEHLSHVGGAGNIE